MNNTVKIILIVSGAILTLCLCLVAVGFVAYRQTGRVLTAMVNSDPIIIEARNDIAEYTLPAGFAEENAVSIANFSMVTHTAFDGRTHIFFLQAPTSLNLDQEKLERQMNTASGRDPWHEVHVIEEKPCQIRGEETTLVISEGQNHEGDLYRSASAVFEGNGGTAMVNVSGPAESWDQQMVDSLIASIH